MVVSPAAIRVTSSVPSPFHQVLDAIFATCVGLYNDMLNEDNLLEDWEFTPLIDPADHDGVRSLPMLFRRFADLELFDPEVHVVDGGPPVESPGAEEEVEQQPHGQDTDPRPIQLDSYETLSAALIEHFHSCFLQKMVHWPHK